LELIMANADHTARARPKVHSRANSHTPLTTQASLSNLSDANLASIAIVQMLAKALSAQCAHRHRNAPAQPWRMERSAINGLSAALKIVSERAEALRRSSTEDRSV
jgi:hypothetical protein